MRIPTTHRCIWDRCRRRWALGKLVYVCFVLIEQRGDHDQISSRCVRKMSNDLICPLFDGFFGHIATLNRPLRKTFNASSTSS